MTSTLTCLGLGYFFMVALILGGYLGWKGFAATFTDEHNPMRIPLMVLAATPVLVMLWMQESLKFTATPKHIAIEFGLFIGAFVAGSIVRAKQSP